MAKLMLLWCFIAVLYLRSGAKHFERCELVYELRRQGFPEDTMRDWVCLVEIESGRHTNIIGPVNKDGTRDYGLYQINDKWWCNKGSKPGKTCNITCGERVMEFGWVPIEYDRFFGDVWRRVYSEVDAFRLKRKMNNGLHHAYIF